LTDIQNNAPLVLTFIERKIHLRFTSLEKSYLIQPIALVLFQEFLKKTMFVINKKKCNQCNEEKPVYQFSKSLASFDGLNNQCKACKSVYKKQWTKSYYGKSNPFDRTWGARNI
jgi:hypothetical protein